MLQRSQVERRERFRKRLVWLYAITLAGVLMMLGAALFPQGLGRLRRIGMVVTSLGGLAQIWASIVQVRGRR